MEKFRWDRITLVWLKYLANKTLHEYVGFLEAYCPEILPTSSHFFGVIFYRLHETEFTMA